MKTLQKITKTLQKTYTPSVLTQSYIEQEKDYNCNNYAPIPIVIEKAEGAYVYSVDGKKYLDCIAAYSSLNQGHLHPEIKKTFISQLENCTLTSRAVYNDKLLPATKYLCETFNYEKAILMNTGVEAGETALKFARRWGYEVKKIPENQAEQIFALKNFWGRTIAASGTSEDPDRFLNFGPFVPNTHLVEYNNLEALEKMLKERPNVASVMLEPIQGEGGVNIPDLEYMQGVRKLCDQYNVLLIIDEVQTGLGRTGKMLCQEHFDIKGDLVCLGKALSGGFMPISAVLGNDEVFERIVPGSHGSTYGGNPLACVTLIKSLEVLQHEGMVENANLMGQKLLTDLKEILGGYEAIKDIRGKGLFVGIELREGGVKGKDFVMEMLNQGVLTKQTQDYILRLAPPLIIGEKEVDFITRAFDKVAKKLLK